MNDQHEVRFSCDNGIDMPRTGDFKIADILLIQCPPWDIDMPPLGVSYLAAYLGKVGYKVAVMDFNIHMYSSMGADFRHLWNQRNYNCWIDEDLFFGDWCEMEEAARKGISTILRLKRIKHIGLSVNFASFRFAGQMIKLIKEINKDINIIVGGWGCVSEHMRSLFPVKLIDAFIVGEGEETLNEVMEVFNGQRPSESVSGAIFIKDQSSVYKPRIPAMDIDDLPYPTFSEIDLKHYATAIFPLYTSRGCIGQCSFCNDWNLTRPFRVRSPQNVINEIVYHIRNNNARMFSFKDLACNGDMNRLNLLCEAMIDLDFRISWDSQAIPRKEMTYEVLRKLKQSGCAALIYGVESFSDGVLKRMKKMFTGEIAERVIKDTHRAGIKPLINIIVGFPGETVEEFERTCEAIIRNKEYISQISAVSVCLINNDSQLWLNYRDYGLFSSPDSIGMERMWRSLSDGNTYETRKERAEKIISIIEKAGLSYITKTV